MGFLLFSMISTAIACGYSGPGYSLSGHMSYKYIGNDPTIKGASGGMGSSPRYKDLESCIKSAEESYEGLIKRETENPDKDRKLESAKYYCTYSETNEKITVIDVSGF